MNTLTTYAKPLIWMPSLIFSNTKYQDKATFQDDDSVVMISKNPSEIKVHLKDIFVKMVYFFQILQEPLAHCQK